MCSACSIPSTVTSNGGGFGPDVSPSPALSAASSTVTATGFPEGVTHLSPIMMSAMGATFSSSQVSPVLLIIGSALVDGRDGSSDRSPRNDRGHSWDSNASILRAQNAGATANSIDQPLSSSRRYAASIDLARTFAAQGIHGPAQRRPGLHPGGVGFPVRVDRVPARLWNRPMRWCPRLRAVRCPRRAGPRPDPPTSTPRRNWAACRKPVERPSGGSRSALPPA